MCGVMFYEIMGGRRGQSEMRGIEDHSSPNFGPRRGGAVPDLVVLHYTGMDTAEAAIARLADPASEVSAQAAVRIVKLRRPTAPPFGRPRVWRTIPETSTKRVG